VLRPGGSILLEIGSTQGPSAFALARTYFSQAEIHLHQDMAGHDRVLEVQL
jgi:methylase of polypeptide subunit release factors